ncbi:MAG: EpsG family protein, partial [Proteobacteria bacterium]
FVVPAFAALQEKASSRENQHRAGFLIGIGLLFTILIGLRYHVGADWDNYLIYLDLGRVLSLGDVFLESNPGYVLTNWIASHTFNSIWVSNLLCAVIFSYGLIEFSKIQPRPYLAILVAVPYLLIVVAMGYSRQGVAIGAVMAGLVALIRDRTLLKFFLWIAFATTFHKTALLLAPIVALSMDRGRIWNVSWIGAATAALYYVFLRQEIDFLLFAYIEAQYSSQGAAIRVAMNAVPAAIFLAARKRFGLSPFELRLWTNVSLLAFLCIAWLAVSPSSTAVDRMALYLIPLQIVVFSRFSEIFKNINPGMTQFITIGVVIYLATVQFVWLNFATHAMLWVPYRIYPIFSPEAY